mgnify:CR=1 FL=1
MAATEAAAIEAAEDLPVFHVRMLLRAELIQQVPVLVQSALDAYGLARDAVQVWVAPRRFAISATGLPERQSGEAKSVAGPPAAAAFDADGKPTPAAEGFARKQGVAVDQLVVRAGRDGREVVFADVAGDAREMAELGLHGLLLDEA